MLKKKKDSTNVRECREWYCSAAQWVSDFGRLQLAQDASADGGLAGGASSAAVGEGGGMIYCFIWECIVLSSILTIKPPSRVFKAILFIKLFLIFVFL